MKTILFSLIFVFLTPVCLAQNFSFEYNERRDSFGFSFGGPRPRYDYYQPAPIVPVYPSYPYYIAPPTPVYPAYPYYRPYNPYNCPPHRWGPGFNHRHHNNHDNGGHGHNHNHKR